MKKSSVPAFRRPVSLRVSITSHCQLQCLYCVPPKSKHALTRPRILSLDEIFHFVRVLKRHFNLAKVRLTGGEPLLRTGIIPFVEKLALEGIPDLAITTNGQLLAEMAKDLKKCGLNRINISLDTLDPDTFGRLTRGGKLNRTLLGIEAAQEAGFAPVKINTVVLRGYNDFEVERLARWAFERSCSIRFIELMPIGHGSENFESLFVPASTIRNRIERYFTLKPLPYQPHQSSRNFVASSPGGKKGIIGFISPVTKPFCDGCTRLRLTCTGSLITCLARGLGDDVSDYLQCKSPFKEQALVKRIAGELEKKSRRGAFNPSLSMVGVGG